jgi:hypothetical protein
MASNSLSGINLAQIAQQTLDTLLAKLVPVRAFTTDFSSDVAVTGESVTTRVASSYSAQDFSSTTTAANSTLTSKTITLNNYKGVRIEFSDSEWSKSSINLFNVFMNPVAHAVANDMMDSALALVTDANFGSAAFTGSSAAFDWNDVADISKVLTEANVPKDDRFLIISPSYFAALAKDIKGADVWGNSQVIQGLSIPQVGGFSVYEYNDIPSNSENLVGLAGASQGILIAARVPAIPANFPGEIEQATDADSGITMQVRRWYSADDRQWKMEAGLIYGVAVGNAGNVKRLVSE